jgi:hypothetical protein
VPHLRLFHLHLLLRQRLLLFLQLYALAFNLSLTSPLHHELLMLLMEHLLLLLLLLLMLLLLLLLLILLN